MTQEDKDLLLKDLCTRLPYGVCVHIRYKEGEPCYGKLTPRDIQWFIDSSIKVIKPYLRPMSSMTEYESKEFALLQTDFYIDGFLYPIASINMVNWLNKHHFDYCGLIEKGIALPAKEGMYN